MNIKYKINLCAGIGSIIFGLIVWFLIPSQIEVEKVSKYGINSRTIPYVLVTIFIAGGVALVIQSLVFKKDTIRILELKKELKAFMYMSILLIYAFLFNINFMLSLGFLGVATLLIMKTRKVLYYIIVIILTIILYLLFTHGLNMRLP